MTETTVANVVFIISTQTMFLAIFGYFILKEKVSFVAFISIILAMLGIIIMVGDSVFTGSLFGNLIALAIPINFSILVMIIRKYPKLDMVPAIFYSGIFSCIYGIILSDSFKFIEEFFSFNFSEITIVNSPFGSDLKGSSLSMSVLIYSS